MFSFSVHFPPPRNSSEFPVPTTEDHHHHHHLLRWSSKFEGDTIKQLWTILLVAQVARDVIRKRASQIARATTKDKRISWRVTPGSDEIEQPIRSDFPPQLLELSFEPCPKRNVGEEKPVRWNGFAEVISVQGPLVRSLSLTFSLNSSCRQIGNGTERVGGGWVEMDDWTNSRISLGLMFSWEIEKEALCLGMRN